VWDNGYPSGGNYWDDYNGTDQFSGPDQNIPGPDGIGDYPYDIPDSITHDYYPYMSQDGWLNHPPNKPTITGPTRGDVGNEYEFTVSATDPDGDPLAFFISWGDGTDTGWISHDPPSQQLIVSHEWNKRGTYEMKAKVKDTHELEGSWSDSFAISIVGPMLNITMKGGIGLTLFITNEGDADATNVNWNVTFTGGIMVRPKGGQSEGTINTISPGDQAETNIFVFGIGRTEIAIEIEAENVPPVQTIVDAFILGPFVVIR
jgi:hypothetical protein